MLFDLRGRRRRAVQATYLILAVLMGGGLVLFGIGSDASGGLFDAFSENRSGGGSGGPPTADSVAKAEARLRANPRDEAALKEAVRGHYQLAAEAAGPETAGFPPQAVPELAKAAGAWERYLALKPRRVDDKLADRMFQVYSERGLNRPAEAARAAEIVAEARPSDDAFFRVALYATVANQARKAEIAGRKATKLASPRERSTLRRELRQIERAAKQARAATRKRARLGPAPPRRGTPGGPR